MSHINVPERQFHTSCGVKIECIFKSRPDDFEVREIWEKPLELNYEDLADSLNIPLPPVHTIEYALLTQVQIDEMKHEIAAFINNEETITVLNSLNAWDYQKDVEYSIPPIDNNRDSRRDFIKKCRLIWPHISQNFLHKEDSDILDKVVARTNTDFLSLQQYGLSLNDIRAWQLFTALGPNHEKADDGIVIGRDLNRETRKILYAQNQIRRSKLFQFTSRSNCSVQNNDQKASEIHVTWSRNVVNRAFKSFDYYLCFTLKKINYEHFAMIRALTNAVGCSCDMFSSAGIKDKVSISFQRCAMKLQRRMPSRKRVRNDYEVGDNNLSWLSEAARRLIKGVIELPHNDAKRLHIGHIEWKSSPILRGSHRGNAFSILLRNVHAFGNVSLSDIVQILKERLVILQRDGFPNYFGTQRFGGCEGKIGCGPIVGKAMLFNQWNKALSHIVLNTNSDDDQEEDQKVNGDGDKMKVAKNLFQNGASIQEILKALPMASHLERHVVSRMDQPEQAIRSLPREQKDLAYLRYFGWIWNKVASMCVCESNIAHDISIPALGRKFCMSKNETIATAYRNVLQNEGIRYDSTMNVLDNEYAQKISLASNKDLPPAKNRALFAQVKDASIEVEEEQHIRIRFSLGVGSYATVLLRELLQSNDI